MPRLEFARKQTTPNGPANVVPPWRLLIVDDEEEVHAVTELSLRHFHFDGRPVEFLHAYSAAEARKVLTAAEDVHLVLLDVVMETDDAGLQLVDYVRREVDDQKVRIVLRTGQPGRAPESEIIVKYDVNDYHLKTDLTHQKLFTAVVTALRGYQQLVQTRVAAAMATEACLRKVVDASSSISELASVEAFAESILQHASALIGAADHGLVYALDIGDQLASVPEVLARSGRFRVAADIDPTILTLVGNAMRERQSLVTPERAVLSITTPMSREFALYLELRSPLDELERLLLEVYTSNIAVCFDNLEMVEEILAANKTLEDRVASRTKELAERSARFQAILDGSPAGVIIGDQSGTTISFANARFATIMGCDPDEALEVRLIDHFIDRDAADIYRRALVATAPVTGFDAALRRRSGESFWATISVGHPTDSPSGYAVIWLDDISERRVQAETLQRMVREDDLTGIARRKHFLHELALELKRARRQQHPLAVMMIDIDQFKLINDTHGHAAGDEALRGVTKCCLEVLRESDLIARVGGDEFAVLLRETSLDMARVVGEHLRQKIEEMVLRLPSGEPFHTTVSIGLTDLAQSDQEIETVLHRADSALYESKRRGRNCLSVAI